MPKMRIIIDIEETEGFNWEEAFEHWSISFPSIAHTGGLTKQDGTNIYLWTKQNLTKNPDEKTYRLINKINNHLLVKGNLPYTMATLTWDVLMAKKNLKDYELQEFLVSKIKTYTDKELKSEMMTYMKNYRK